MDVFMITYTCVHALERHGDRYMHLLIGMAVFSQYDELLLDEYASTHGSKMIAIAPNYPICQIDETLAASARHDKSTKLAVC